MRRLRESGAPLVVLDVRREQDVAGSGHAEGTTRLRPDLIVEREAKALDLPRDAWLIAFCACPNDQTSLKVAKELRRAGWPRARALEGGWEVWKKTGLPNPQQ
jgi:rhodanese-related sulfurtransferase